MDEDAGLKAHLYLLQQQKQLLKKAKSRAGQQPTQAMRRSRQHLEQEFLTAVMKFFANIKTALFDSNIHSLAGSERPDASDDESAPNEHDIHRRSLPAVGPARLQSHPDSVARSQAGDTPQRTSTYRQDIL